MYKYFYWEHPVFERFKMIIRLKVISIRIVLLRIGIWLLNTRIWLKNKLLKYVG